VPLLELSNNVVRQYKDLVDDFLRITFIDENHEKGYYFTEKNASLTDYIDRIMIHGTIIGKKFFKFISHSNSQ
jgi:hypothetical protein